MCGRGYTLDTISPLLARRSSMKYLGRALAVIAVCAGIVAACGGSASGPDDTDGGKRVLFIGNSLTYTNDLKGLVSSIARDAGDTINATSVAFADFALIDHLREGTAVRRLQERHWDYVVMQQGPSSTSVNRDSLILWAKMFEPYIVAAGAKPAMFMVWPDSSRIGFMDAVHESYRAAATAVDGLFMPAGDAWTLAWQAEPALPLYGPDNFHPSDIGSALAALVIVEQITGRDPRTFPTQPLEKKLRVSTSIVRVLQNAAHTANAIYSR
jgi:hypothetical protein